MFLYSYLIIRMSNINKHINSLLKTIIHGHLMNNLIILNLIAYSLIEVTRDPLTLTNTIFRKL